jgi:hypothetical protein
LLRAPTPLAPLLHAAGTPQLTGVTPTAFVTNAAATRLAG